MSPRMRWRADVALVFVCMVWGTTFVLVKEALADVSTLLFLATRFALAATALALVFLRPMRRAANPGRRYVAAWWPAFCFSADTCCRPLD